MLRKGSQDMDPVAGQYSNERPRWPCSAVAVSPKAAVSPVSLEDFDDYTLSRIDSGVAQIYSAPAAMRALLAQELSRSGGGRAFGKSVSDTDRPGRVSADGRQGADAVAATAATAAAAVEGDAAGTQGPRRRPPPRHSSCIRRHTADNCDLVFKSVSSCPGTTADDADGLSPSGSLSSPSLEGFHPLRPLPAPVRIKSYSCNGSAPVPHMAVSVVAKSRFTGSPHCVPSPAAPDDSDMEQAPLEAAAPTRRSSARLFALVFLVGTLAAAWAMGYRVEHPSQLWARFSNLGPSESAEEQLILWAIREGAKLRVTIGRNAEGVRGLYTTEDVLQDEVLLDIPEHIIFSFRSAPAAETAPHLIKELHNREHSRLSPYLAVLPGPDEVLTAYNWPDEYIPFLASEALEQQVLTTFKRYAEDAWNGELYDSMDMTLREAVGNTEVPLEEYAHAVSVITSRTIQVRPGSVSMIPIADMANHHPLGGQHVGGSSARGNNFQFIASRDFKKGEEVQVSYGDLRNDELMLYYGFVDEVTQPPMLCACDHRDYANYAATSEPLPQEDLTGPYEAVQAELYRLEDALRAYDSRMHQLGPIPSTKPHVARVLAAFHRLRRAAITAEIYRLRSTLHSYSD